MSKASPSGSPKRTDSGNDKRTARARKAGIAGWVKGSGSGWSLTSVMRSILVLGAALALFGALVLTALVGLAATSLPDFDTLVKTPRGQMVVIKAFDGQQIATIGPAYGEWLSGDALPQTIRTAMVAIEDRRFHRHIGVDPRGIARSMMINLKAGRFVQGGSTITQQVVKNVFLTQERTLNRKMREMVLALALEVKFSKDQILELYLNRVYFGGGAYGVDAASRRFYGHSARQLSMPEAAIIAGLVKAPTRYAPTSDPEKARERAKLVIATLAETGQIAETESLSTQVDTLRFARQPRRSSVGYFADWILSQVETLTSESVLPLEVETTLNPDMQRDAEEAITRLTPKGVQAALVAMSHDGAIRAMIGGRDYVESSYNRAVTAERQPGSAFKLFVYLAALEHGVLSTDMVEDGPIEIDGWSPRNYDRGYAGFLSVRDAFALSKNTVSARLGQEVGFNQVADMARRMGISTPLQRTPAITLGASEVTLLDMTSAYASVASAGVEVRPFGIARIRTGSGEILYERQAPSPRQVLGAEVAAEMTRLMENAVNTGTGRAAQIGRPVAGKTGTTNSNKDGWFMGFTADLTGGVWMGRDDAQAVSGLAGGKMPAQVWASFMKEATRGMPVTPLFADTSNMEERDPFEEAYGLAPEGEGDIGFDALADPQMAEPEPGPAVGQPLDRDWLNRVLEQPAPGPAEAPAPVSPPVPPPGAASGQQGMLPANLKARLENAAG